MIEMKEKWFFKCVLGRGVFYTIEVLWSKVLLLFCPWSGGLSTK